MKIATAETTAELLSRAAASPRKRMNLNLHDEPTDPISRFLNAGIAGSYVRPHRHRIGGQHEECEQLMNFIYNDYLPHHHPDLIIMADRWGDFDYEAGLAGLETPLDWLRQRQFAVLLAGPDHNWDVAPPTRAETEMRGLRRKVAAKGIRADFAGGPVGQH
jgi:hypothetical protein